MLDSSVSSELILLVEDNEVNRRLVNVLLRSRNYRVVEAASAAEALHILRTERPDLILMDIQLPDDDGLDVTRMIKADPATHDIPVVAVTSYAMKGDREKALAVGCVGYITKPIDKATFLDDIGAFLERAGGV